MKRVIEPEVTVKAIDLANLVLWKVKAGKINILPQPVQIVALRNDAHVALDALPQEDLRGRLAVFLGDLSIAEPNILV